MSVMQLGVREKVVGEVGGAGCVNVKCVKPGTLAGGKTGKEGGGGRSVEADHCVDYDWSVLGVMFLKRMKGQTIMFAGSFAQGLVITQILVLDGLNPWVEPAKGICTGLTADEEGYGGQVLDSWVGGSQKFS